MYARVLAGGRNIGAKTREEKPCVASWLLAAAGCWLVRSKSMTSVVTGGYTHASVVPGGKSPFLRWIYGSVVTVGKLDVNGREVLWSIITYGKYPHGRPRKKDRAQEKKKERKEEGRKTRVPFPLGASVDYF